ncbi:guanine-N(7)--methyltransferase subunit TRM82 [Massarina eburnea CBS 473.64]|uniref:Guanine-N(7)--methyltransferase subunit TRM82 n=1 Tax=Massarina eburnea CBS 473.64 TaxID=1395130 RepID=A0A6A6RRH0_9PLEO|nr:guanine-N(7)--methyltransferase subunit TRM82 [Massarina eburnea CBS 473.64]
MTLPYQCLAACSRSTGDGDEWALFGAAGSELVVQSSTGIASVWPAEESQAKNREEAQEPAEKRVKLSPAVEQKPNFTTLKVSHDKKHLIGTTAEDKCIRVFEIEAGWRLKQISERCMARRPCSIDLTSNDSTILCADKFGDVYSLPLIPPPEDELNVMPESEKAQKKFLPSASLSTVHSGRNRKVLEEQLKQAEKGRPQPKDAPKFKHDLLLGHVSMLTDIVSATVGSRSYIITVDRDEHIRVSRGLPQAHIIEGFCHGHEEFVNRLCLTQSGRLISGGGDAHLYVWDWLSYRLLEKLPIQAAVLDYFQKHPELELPVPEKEGNFKVAVSGIWNVPFGNSTEEILVACEGVPALFSFIPGSSPSLSQTLPLSGNALSVAFIGARTAVVSVDHMHKAGSTTQIRDDQGVSRIQCFSIAQDGQWARDDTLTEPLAWFSHDAGEGEHADGRAAGTDDDTARAGFSKKVRTILYGVGNLRKRPEAEAEIAT